MSTKYTNDQLATLNKVQLRELCRNNGIGYNGLNNDGMRVALLTVVGDEVVQDHNDATLETATAEVVQEVPTTLPAPGDVLTETAEREVLQDEAVVVVQPDAEPLVLGNVQVEPAREPRVLPTLVAPVVPAPKPEKVRKIQANRPEANGVKRPSEGTICAQIWAWCDEVHGAGDVVRAKELRAALPALDDTTKTVQYYRWRKFNNIQGRQ